MTPLYLAVVPGRSGWDQLVLHTGVLQSNVKQTEFRIADVLVCKLRPIIRLDCLNLERKYFLKHFEELYRVFRCMLLKPVNKSYSGAFVYGCPLVKVLFVPSRCAFQAVIRHFFNVYLHFFSRDENLGIPAVTLAYVWLFLLASAQSESFGSIDPETGVCANFVDY